MPLSRDRGDALGSPRQGAPDDHARVLRLLARRHRDMARLGNKHYIRLHALLLELESEAVGDQLVGLRHRFADTVAPRQDRGIQQSQRWEKWASLKSAGG